MEKSVSISFGSWILAPATLILVSFFLRIKLTRGKIFEIYTIYGYNYILFIYASIVSLVPIELVQMIAFGVAGILSTFSMAKNFKTYMDSLENESNGKYILIGVAVFWQIFLTFVFYYFFFSG